MIWGNSKIVYMFESPVMDTDNITLGSADKNNITFKVFFMDEKFRAKAEHCMNYGSSLPRLDPTDRTFNHFFVTSAEWPEIGFDEGDTVYLQGSNRDMDDNVSVMQGPMPSNRVNAFHHIIGLWARHEESWYSDEDVY